MKFKVLVCCALGMALSPSAFAQKVSVEYAHQVSFAGFRTCRWGKVTSYRLSVFAFGEAKPLQAT
jgi:hypothetical protein